MNTRLTVGMMSLLLLAVAACSSTVKEPQSIPRGDVITAPPPPGVDSALWADLTSELARQLATRGTSAAKAIDDPALRVTDFALIAEDPETRTLTFGWSYKLAGDYDLNGEVTISDLAPIAKYLDRTSASPDWEKARLADGDGNGQVNSADIVTIAANFGTKVHGFFFAPEFADYNGNLVVELSDLNPIGAYMLRPNPTSFMGPMFLQDGQIGADFQMRPSDTELPTTYLGLYGFSQNSNERLLQSGRISFSVIVGFAPEVDSTYFTVVPFLETGASLPGDRWELGQLSDQILYVHPQ